MNSDVLELFNCIVVENSRPRLKGKGFNTAYIDNGVVLDFVPSAQDILDLQKVFKPLPMRTLFTREERENAGLSHLLAKQFLHYVEVYGLGMPGLFDLEVNTGTVVSLRYVRGITVKELQKKIDDLLYSNAPVADAGQVKRIIHAFHLYCDLNKIKNNELRVQLWTPQHGPLKSGDDAVRYMVLAATEQSLLIKSREVIQKVKEHQFSHQFLDMHVLPLAQVFNRHKRIILAAKNKGNASVINRISRLSKSRHVPVGEPLAKTFIAGYLSGKGIPKGFLSDLSVRQKLTYLAALAELRSGNKTRLFKIRNGKIFYKGNDRKYVAANVTDLEDDVLVSLARDLFHLNDQSILLDKHVDYGLPISRKQALGRLPFGTKITSDHNEISSGMYWENAWGARDLDLSAVRQDGHRVGWGSYSGYTDDGIIFSGDVTSAPNGAMEFMTSRNQEYGIITNIYSGDLGSEMELVVGTNSGKTQRLTETLVREKYSLNSKQCLLGFVKDKTFTVYSGRMNNRIVSGVNPMLEVINVDFWTVGKLLASLGISFDVEADPSVEYDHDLRYAGFSFDKLEALLGTTKGVP